MPTYSEYAAIDDYHEYAKYYNELVQQNYRCIKDTTIAKPSVIIYPIGTLVGVKSLDISYIFKIIKLHERGEYYSGQIIGIEGLFSPISYNVMCDQAIPVNIEKLIEKYGINRVVKVLLAIC